MTLSVHRLRKYVGPLDFYQKVTWIAIPLALQQFLNSAMGVVDSIMVARINQVSAVGTAAQIEILMMTIAYGAASGAAIYMAQFFGSNDHINQRKSFGFGIILVSIIALLWMFLVAMWGPNLIRFYINDQQVIVASSSYLQIVLWGYLPSTLTMMFSFAYRSIQRTIVPMVIGVIAMVINVFLNYSLIFGNFGFPQLGLVGAAYATLIAHVIGFMIHLIYAHSTHQSFIGPFSTMFAISKDLFNKMFSRTYPLIVNELFFGFGSTLYIRAFGRLGTKAMDSYYVGMQIANIFMFVIMGINTANSSMLGAELGKGDLVAAKTKGNYFVGMAIVISILTSIVILLTSRQLVGLFGLQDPVVVEGAILIVNVFSVRLSLRMFNVLVFSSLRAGGDSKFLAFLDAGILWLVGLPLAFFLVNGLGIQNIALVFLIVQLEQLVRVLIGFKRYTQGVWLKNLTQEIA